MTIKQIIASYDVPNDSTERGVIFETNQIPTGSFIEILQISTEAEMLVKIEGIGGFEFNTYDPATRVFSDGFTLGGDYSMKRSDLTGAGDTDFVTTQQLTVNVTNSGSANSRIVILVTFRPKEWSYGIFIKSSS